MSDARRATTMAELQALQARMMSPDDVQRWLDFRPRPGDVIIAPYGKCGTTWLQQIFHTLRTRGDMDFDDISRVVPWIETAAALGLDLDADQKAEPRGFKSHLPYKVIPKGCRYIVSIRDPKDALVSAFRFMEGWFVEPGTITLDEFARKAFMADRGRPNYWSHLVSWWEVRDDPAVLMLSYESMLQEPAGAIRRISTHAGIPLDDALLALTLRHSSLEFMLEHKARFDDRLMRDLSERNCGLPPGGDSAKVRHGQAGSHRVELSDDVSAEMDARWRERVTPRLGYRDYAELERHLAADSRMDT